MKIEYRTENAYGSGVRDLADILAYEICELGNDGTVNDIVNAGYADAANLGFDPDNPDESIGDTLAREIRRTTGRDLKYGLWLAEKEDVKELYDGSDEDIDGYEISDICLVDLGPDGRLYAYEELPRPVSGPNA